MLAICTMLKIQLYIFLWEVITSESTVYFHKLSTSRLQCFTKSIHLLFQILSSSWEWFKASNRVHDRYEETEEKRNSKRHWQFVTNMGETTRRYSAWLGTLNHYHSGSQIPVNSLSVLEKSKSKSLACTIKGLGQVLVSHLHAAREPVTFLAPSLGK